MELEPDKLSTRERYSLMISVITPRPIAWVSTVDEKGRANLAPFSFFTGITAKPMTLCFAPACGREGRKKDTLLNIEATKEFVVNIAAQDSAAQMVQTSAAYPRGVSEFEKAGLSAVPSAVVRPPRVKESPVALECALHRVLTVSEGPLGGNLVIGEVRHVHVVGGLWKDGKIFHQDLQALGRLEGNWYARATDTFEIARPKAP